MRSTRRRCRQCEFWDPGTIDRSKGEQGWCHHSAPIPYDLRDDGGYRLASWPMTYAADWCGEFKVAGGSHAVAR